MTVVGTAIEAAEVGVGVVSKATSALSWIPWALAAASLIAGAGGTIWYRMQWVDCRASIAIDANAAQEKARLQTERDNKLIRELSVQLAPIVTSIDRQKSDVQVALAKTKPNADCSNTDAARAFDNIVRPSTGQTGNSGPPETRR